MESRGCGNTHTSGFLHQPTVFSCIWEPHTVKPNISPTIAPEKDLLITVMWEMPVYVLWNESLSYLLPLAVVCTAISSACADSFHICKWPELTFYSKSMDSNENKGRFMLKSASQMFLLVKKKKNKQSHRSHQVFQKRSTSQIAICKDSEIKSLNMNSNFLHNKIKWSELFYISFHSSILLLGDNYWLMCVYFYFS